MVGWGFFGVVGRTASDVQAAVKWVVGLGVLLGSAAAWWWFGLPWGVVVLLALVVVVVAGSGMRVYADLERAQAHRRQLDSSYLLALAAKADELSQEVFQYAGYGPRGEQPRDQVFLEKLVEAATIPLDKRLRAFDSAFGTRYRSCLAELAAVEAIDSREVDLYARIDGDAEMKRLAELLAAAAQRLRS